MIVLVKLLLAHLIGDFLLQPTAWVVNKEKKKHKSIYLYYHILLHGVLAFAIVFEKDFLWYALLLAIFHGIIDYIKLQFQTKKTKRFWFLLDQFLHVITLFAITFFYTKIPLDLNFFGNNFWIILTGIVLLTKPTSIIIRNIISIWTPEKKTKDNSLENAGNYIGILERLFIFCFILTNHFEAIGFLLAAKSIFRFGDLKAAKDRKLTEYVLIGTLLSFGIALLIGLLVQLAIF
ncbi:DUF3307 domain-containing protein [Flavobacterium sp.]|uniref:DUF3307 domain-containing protein n=1 Tax=Flavobacterium sp. TaxID=239 RepID=UPI002FDE4581